MPDWSGTLHFRHRRLFKHRADLWEPDLPLPPDGRPESTTYTLVLSNVPCLRDTKSAIDTPGGVIAVIESDDMMTADTFRFPPGVPLDSSWLVIDRSLTPNGQPGLKYNQTWICKGEPVTEEDTDAVRTTGMVDAYATRIVRAPAEVRTHYGLP